MPSAHHSPQPPDKRAGSRSPLCGFGPEHSVKGESPPGTGMRRLFADGFVSALAHGRPSRGHARVQVEQQLKDARKVLRNGLCAVCREHAATERRWLSFFVSESHDEEGMRTRVRNATGFCPAHTRRLLAGSSASWLMPQVVDLALQGAEGALVAGEPYSPARCPACDAGREAVGRTLDTLTSAYQHAGVREAVEQGALCLPHTALLIPRLAHDAATHLAGATAESCGTSDRWTATGLGGDDPDAGAREADHVRLDALLREGIDPLGPVTGRRADRTRRTSCPSCLAAHLGVRRLLRWHGDSIGDGGPAGHELALCGSHLHDLLRLDGPNTRAVVAHNLTSWQERLTRYSDAGATTKHGEASPSLLTSPRCRACAEAQIMETREAALLAALLRDPVHTRAYEHAHGLCAHHALLHRDTTPTTARRVLSARLSLLHWENDETLRRQDWRTRHETGHPTTPAWCRAPATLDGRVHSGMPPPP